MTGGVKSCTVTVNDAEAVLPWLSVAVQVTLVAPTGNVDPEAGLQSGVIEPSTRSVADSVNVTTAPGEPLACTVMAEGTVTLGALVSWTVAWKEPVAVLPWLSVAEQLTVVVVMVNVEPDAGAQMGVIAPSTRSKAEGVYETVAPLGPGVLEPVRVGRVRSIITVTELELVKPEPFVAVQVSVFPPVLLLRMIVKHPVE